MKNRTDIVDFSISNSVKFFRCMNLKRKQKDEYKNLNGTETSKMLHGYTATTLNIESALQFAGEYQEDENYPVILEMIWKYETNYYVIDGGAYSHEREILLCDGLQFKVVDYNDNACRNCLAYKHQKWIKDKPVLSKDKRMYVNDDRTKLIVMNIDKTQII